MPGGIFRIPVRQVSAADETRHAALAWRTLRWLLDRYGSEVAVALLERFARVAPPPLPRADRTSLVADGRLSNRDRAEVHRRVFTDMISPLFFQLVSGLGHQPPRALS